MTGSEPSRQPDVTVIVPVYDAMPYLTACLDSLVGQTIGHDRMHVVTVDDGSTDGSGEELERYAAAHPGLFTVHHQANSGGPARPCNVGLDLAKGRYVFFLGADDHLGLEAVERMVHHADTWESDVLCVKMTGTGGRWINQQLFRANAPEVPFPSEALASILSNTKLFRRELLERHRIRFALDMRVGSDQTFTVTAMHHARRVSAAADYDYYFAVRRGDSTNLTYTSTWRHRLEAMTGIVEHVAELLEPGPGRDAILQRHFHNELAVLLREDFHALDQAEQELLVAGVNGLAGDYLTDGILMRLTVPTRLRYLLAREGRLDELRATAGLEEQPPTLLLEGAEGYRSLPDRFELTKDLRRITRERPGEYLRDFIAGVQAEWSGDQLCLRLDVRTEAQSRPDAQIALVPAPERRSRRLGRVVPSNAPIVQFQARCDSDGSTLLSSLAVDTQPDCAHSDAWAVRLFVRVGEHTESVPVPAPARAVEPRVLGPRGQRRRVCLEPDPDGRLLLVCSPVGVRRWTGILRRGELRRPVRAALRRARTAMNKG